MPRFRTRHSAAAAQAHGPGSTHTLKVTDDIDEETDVVFVVYEPLDGRHRLGYITSLCAAGPAIRRGVRSQVG